MSPAAVGKLEVAGKPEDLGFFWFLDFSSWGYMPASNPVLCYYTGLTSSSGVGRKALMRSGLPSTASTCIE